MTPPVEGEKTTSGPVRCPLLGLTGLPCAGKSAAAGILAAEGAHVIDADRVGHRILERPAIREAIRARFGPEVLDADGAVMRDALGAKVFAAPGALRALEAILHPPMAAAIREEIRAAVRERTVVLDAALLHRMDMAEDCDAVVAILADRNIRMKRARARGWNPEQLARREAHLPEERILAERADHRIDNNGTRDDLRRQILTIWKETTHA